MGTKLTNAINALITYHAFATLRAGVFEGSFGAGKASTKLEGEPSKPPPPALPIPPSAGTATSPVPDPEIDPRDQQKIIDLILNLSEGGCHASHFVGLTSRSFDAQTITELKKIVDVIYEPDPILIGAAAAPTSAIKKNNPGEVLVDPLGMLPMSILSITAGVRKPEPGTPALYTHVPDGEGAKGSINYEPLNPNRFSSPALSAFNFKKLVTSPQTRHTDAVSLFMNSMPTVPMSLCAPFLDIRFVSQKPAVTNDGFLSDMSLVKFLGVYNAKQKDDPVNFGLAAATPELYADNAYLQSIGISKDVLPPPEATYQNLTSAGMELVTAPQTLVNPGGSDGVSRANAGLAKVIDPFRPFMTLREVTIREYGSGEGIIGFKRATLSLRLHDRGRLAEIASLISPDSFSLTSLYMEYGWSNPAGDNFTFGTPTDYYATFLNALRCKEKFRLIKGQYSLRPDGQVDIELTAGSEGGEDAFMVNVASGPFVPASLIEALIRRETRLAEMQGDNKPAMEDLLPRVHMTTPSARASSSMVPKSFLNEILDVIGKRAKGEADSSTVLSTLKEKLEELVGDDGTEGSTSLITSATPDVASQIASKILGLNSKAGTPDPYLIDVPNIAIEGYPLWRTATPLVDNTNPVNAAPDAIPVKTVDGAPFVSLGKVVLSLMGAPLAASGRFDEVQVMFYPFNANSGAMRNSTLANFPISLPVLSEKLSKSTSVGALTTSQVMTILASFVDNPGHPAYGFATAYQGTKETATDPEKDKDIGVRLRDRLIASGVITSTYHPPLFQCYIESVPAIVDDVMRSVLSSAFSQSSISALSDPGTSICRIHIFDYRATPYIGQKFLLESASVENVTSIYADNLDQATSELESGDDSGAASSIKTMIEAVATRTEGGMLKMISDPDSGKNLVFKLNASPTDLHSLIKTVTPTITFGSQYTAIDSLTMNSNTSGLLADALISEALSGRNTNPQKPPAGKGLIGDVTVIPATVSLECMGMPLVRYGQQFFLDMGTGTKADNIYTVVNITHTIGSSGFKTSMSLSYTGQAQIATARDTLFNNLLRLRNITA